MGKVRAWWVRHELRWVNERMWDLRVKYLGSRSMKASLSTMKKLRP